MPDRFGARRMDCASSIPKPECGTSFTSGDDQTREPVLILFIDILPPSNETVRHPPSPCGPSAITCSIPNYRRRLRVELRRCCPVSRLLVHNAGPRDPTSPVRPLLHVFLSYSCCVATDGEVIPLSWGNKLPAYYASLGVDDMKHDIHYSRHVYECIRLSNYNY